MARLHCGAPRGGRRTICASAVLVVALGAACTPGSAKEDEPWRRAPGYVVDSILPIAEQLTRFRDGLEPVESLHGAQSSREALVREWVRAIERRDTIAVRALAMSRAEFAWLYYPSHPYSRPPYEHPPQLFWFQVTANSDKGIGRALQRLGGQSLRYRSHACDETIELAPGDGTIHAACSVTVGAPGDSATTLRLFGAIFEHRGAFKFVSYGNEL